MQLKIYLLQTYSGFENEDLILAFLRKSYSCEIVSNICNANVVIRGVFPSAKYTLIRRGINKLVKQIRLNLDLHSQEKIRDRIDPSRNQLWIHLSGEKPNFNSFSSFYNSECDIGIGHEAINNTNYIRMPHWYQSIDWADFGVPRDLNSYHRLGKPINLDELMHGIPACLLQDKDKCALINSHMTAPRDVFFRQIKEIMPFDIYGLPGNMTNLCKRDILREYNFNLAPENTLYPGYITEKIPEAYACRSFPIGWYLNGQDNEFTADSHLNLGVLTPSDIFGHESILESRLASIMSTIKREGIPPLLLRKPSLSPVISLIEKAVHSLNF